MSSQNDGNLHRVGIIGFTVRREVTVSLRTEDSCLAQQILTKYPGLNKKRQYRIQPWITYRGRQRHFFIFRNLEEQFLKRWLATFEKVHARHPSTEIYSPENPFE